MELSDADWQAMKQAAMRHCQEVMTTLARGGVAAEAELAAQGIYPVSIVHGDAEDMDQVARHEMLHELADQCGTVKTTIGGNAYTTFLFSGPGAEDASLRFIALALNYAAAWWRITPTAQPRFRQ